MPITTSGIQYVDARDVAIAHVRLLEDEPGAGRYLAQAPSSPGRTWLGFSKS
jgi:hypothetical protein